MDSPRTFRCKLQGTPLGRRLPAVVAGMAGSVFAMLGTLTAQDFVMPPLVGAGLYTEILPAGLDARYDGEGFLFGIGLRGTYDSNLFLAENNEEDDIYATIAPWFRYSSAPPGGALWVLNARYAPYFQVFLDHSDLDDFNQAGDASLSYDGQVATLRANVNYSQGSGSDRFAGTRIDQTRFTVGLQGSYYLSEKTSLAASLNYGYQDYGSSVTRETKTAMAQFTAYWQATPLVKVGPSLRWAKREADNIDNSESVGLLLTADYDVTDLVHLNVSGGAESVSYDIESDDTRFTGGATATYRAPDLPWSAEAAFWYGQVQQFSISSRDGGGGDSPFTGHLAVRYEPNEFWALRFGVRYESFPSPSIQRYSTNDLTFTAAATRQLATGMVSGGVDYSFTEYETTGPLATPRDDQDNFRLFLNHRIGLFDERIFLDSNVRYSNNTGGREWSQWQLSTGLNYVF